MRIFLIGFMGSGKSKKGRKLAIHLGYQFIDMDEWIEENENMSIPDIFKTKGEDYFRKKEFEALMKIKELESVVVSTGGGSPCFFDAIELMNASGLTVYLKGTSGFLKERLLQSKKKRPLIEQLAEDELSNFIESKLVERSSFYERAKLKVDAINCKAKDLAELIKPLLNQHK